MSNPMYRQIAEELHEQIDSGRLARGTQLPTEGELMTDYNASRNTVRDAIKWLTNLGLVEKRPGQGTFVSEKVDAFVTTLSGDPATGLGGGEGASYLSEVNAKHRQPSVSSVQVEIQEATGEVAARLRIPEGAEVISRHQKRYIDGTPWSLQTSFYPMDLVNQGAEMLRGARDIKQGTVEYLRETLGIVQVGYRDWFTVRAPNAIEADFFKVPLDGRVAVYEIFRTAFASKIKPVRLTVTVFPTDRNQFIVDVGTVPDPEYQPGRSSPVL